MIIEQVRQVGSPVIRAVAKEVKSAASKATQKIIEDLTDSLRHHGLVGMAAPQIGKSARIFVTEIRATKHRRAVTMRDADPLRVFINPRIISVSKGKTKDWEGCGSVAEAGLFGMVARPTSILVEAFDEHGTPFQLHVSNLLARVIQHEMDHLNGVVFVDTADTKTYMSRGEYRAMQARAAKKPAAKG